MKACDEGRETREREEKGVNISRHASPGLLSEARPASTHGVVGLRDGKNVRMSIRCGKKARAIGQVKGEPQAKPGGRGRHAPRQRSSS